VTFLRGGAIVAVSAASLCAWAAEKPGAAQTQSTAVPVAAPETAFSLVCDGGTFSTFRLKNTKERTYRSPSGDRCSLADDAEGVIWVARGEGFALQDAEKKLSFTDERDRKYDHTCWTRSGAINGVTFTELILAGPADSKGVKVCCGSSCADVQLE
jgi:hypothetical protein